MVTKESNQIKEFIRNNFIEKKPFTLFLILSIFSLLIFIISSLSAPSNQNLNTFYRFVFNFPSFVWFFLFLFLSLSTILSYFNKNQLAVLILIIWVLIANVNIRTSNISYLKDITTNDWTLGPDLDPYLFLRNAIEIDKGVNMGELDNMRYAPLGGFNYKKHLMPWSIYFVYKIINFFGDYSITYAAIISPVIFFTISIIGFFLFVYFLFSFNLSRTKAMIGALLASLLYSFSPSMIHRTVAGIPELESLGMMWFWFAFLFFVLAWKYNNLKLQIIFGILSGLFTGAMFWTWGGYKYIYMTLALSSFLAFLFQKETNKNTIIFSSFLFSSLIFQYLRFKSIYPIISSLNDTGFSLAVFFLLLISIIFSKINLNNSSFFKRINLPQPIIVLVFSAIFIILSLIIISPSTILNVIKYVIEGILTPFGQGRVGLTVAENKTPYLIEVIENFGYLFWLFFFGLIFLFYESISHFKIKEKIILNLFFLLFLISFLFSRISPNHIFNGENFISKTTYLGGLVIFGIFVLLVLIKAYRNDKKVFESFSKIDFSYILIISFSFWAIVSIRGAIRLFFIISPIILIPSIYFVVRITDYIRSKDETVKLIFVFIFAISSLLLVYIFVNYSYIASMSAKATIPSVYNHQWQRAMSWVRTNTSEGSIFTHWWDYGYWVQTLGERPTVSDGGHYIDFWDHTIGRYLLTTPRPETALSLLKTHNVSYLLIDSTDLGKYGAFSKIGSDKTGQDRFSFIPVMPQDPRQIIETSNSTKYVYVGGYYIDDDISYNLNWSKIFFPAWRAVAGAVIISIRNEDNQTFFEQPEVVLFYNNQQYKLKIRYIYVSGKLIDFGSGIDSVARIIPSIEGNRLNPLGALIYLSPKVKDGLFAQLYLMNDPFNNYETIKLVHIEHDVIVQDLINNGFTNEEFVYYRDFRGPIKIWDTRDIPEDILVREEFLKIPDGWNTITGPWASLDNLKFKNDEE